MKRIGMLMAASAVMWATDPGGLRSRPSASDYPSREAGKDVTIGAAVLTPDQVKAVFATELRDYLVVEVGVYPAAGQTIEVSSADFAMRVGAGNNLVRAANPRAMAAANQRKNTPSPSRGSDINVYPTATIGYESGEVYDPVTGRRRGGGMYGGAGVGVGVGDPGYPQPPRPGSTDRDREVMNQELSDKTLPDMKTSDPIAGYVYFRLPAKARSSALELQYMGVNGKVRVLLPPVRTK